MSKRPAISNAEPGQPCTFEITIRDDGDSAFNGTVGSATPWKSEGLGRLDGVAISEISPPFGCATEPTSLPIACDANLSLGAGESHVHQVTVVIPDDGRFDNAQGPVAGRNCVAVLKPGTPVSGGGALTRVPAGSGNELGGASACHDFTITHEVKKECSAGFVLNADGKCVCPEGTTFRNGQCSTPGRKTHEPKPQEQQCTLLPGMIRTQGGDCICPRGTELSNGACRKVEQPPERQCKLLPGMIRTQSGKCVCPRGTELKNGACRKVEQPPIRQCKLLPGMIRTQNGNCVCPRGTKLVNGQCRKPVVECPRGTRPQNGTCVPDGKQKVCPQGTVGKFPNCRIVQRVKPGFINPGQILKFRNRERAGAEAPNRQAAQPAGDPQPDRQEPGDPQADHQETDDPKAED